MSRFCTVKLQLKREKLLSRKKLGGASDSEALLMLFIRELIH
jgi:hypothetical protein